MGDGSASDGRTSSGLAEASSVSHLSLCGGDATRSDVSGSLERPQEVDDVLLLPSVQLFETVDDLTCLAIAALVGFDSLHQIACSPVMEEKNPLPHAPERGC